MESSLAAKTGYFERQFLKADDCRPAETRSGVLLFFEIIYLPPSYARPQ
jgi:hypothetical protein